jgi:ribosomal protein S24E
VGSAVKRKGQRKSTCNFKFEVAKEIIKTIEKIYRLGKVRGRKSKCERKKNAS